MHRWVDPGGAGGRALKCEVGGEGEGKHSNRSIVFVSGYLYSQMR